MARAADLFGSLQHFVWALGTEPALANNRGVEEKDKGAFVQLDWTMPVFDRTVRGDIGVPVREDRPDLLRILLSNT